jgi:hypothetical protein
MRQPIESLIALQFLTVIVPITLLLLVVLLTEARRMPALGSCSSAVSRILPHSLARIFDHKFAARQHGDAARAAWQPQLQTRGRDDDQ